jgi:hypothetical protein
VGDDAADAFAHRNGSEFHATLSACPALSERGGFLRKAAIISPTIETAISAGLTEPMSRPIGAWIRAISSVLKPCAVSRATRLAWDFREPSAPM